MIVISRELLTEVLERLQETSWSTRNAAENTVCAYGCDTKAERWKDQQEHHERCEYLKLRARLEALLE